MKCSVEIIKLITLLILSVLLVSCSSKVDTSTRIHLLKELSNNDSKEDKLLTYNLADSLLIELSDSLGLSDSLYVELLYIKAIAAKRTKGNSVALIIFDSLIFNDAKDLKRNPEPNIMSYVHSGYYQAVINNKIDTGLTEIKTAIKLAKECGEKCQTELGRATTQLASILNLFGKSDTALSIALRNREFLEQNTPDNYRGLGLLLSTIGNIYSTKGNSYSAKMYYKLADEKYLEISPSLSIRASTLGSLGLLYMQDKEYNKAYKSFNQARVVLKKTKLFDDYVSLRVLSGISQTLLYSGNNIYGRALADSIITAAGKNGPDDVLSEALAALSQFFLNIKDYEFALKNINKSIELKPTATYPLILKSKILDKMEQIQLAEKMLDSALILSQSSDATTKNNQLPILIDLAKIYEREMEFNLSDSLYEIIEEISQAMDGFTNLKAESLDEIAQHYRGRLKYNKAIELLYQSVEIKSRAMNEGYASSTEYLINKASQSLKKTVDMLISTAVDSDDLCSYTRPIINSIIKFKGVSSESILKKNISRYSNGNNGFSSKEDNERLNEINAILSSYYNGIIEFDSIKIASYKSEKKEILQRGDKHFYNNKKLYTDVEISYKKLKERIFMLRETLLEFYKYNYISNTGEKESSNYLSYVIDPAGDSYLTNLVKTEEIEKNIDQFMKEMTNFSSRGKLPNEKETEFIKKILSHLFVDLMPLQVLKKSIRTLIIAPDYKLNLLPFETLYNGNKYLIEKFPIKYILSGRDLLQQNTFEKNENGILVLAAPNISYLNNYSDKVDCFSFKNFVSKKLPNTNDEAHTIEKIFSGDINLSSSIETYFDDEATETLFKRKAVGKKIIHLAAHGFYIPETCKNSNTLTATKFDSEFSRSGILLSKDFSSNNNDDGILTSGEVASLNLTGVELVTLAACESGTGELSSGEGVYGLRRSFLIAGVNTVVSSLWQMDDNRSAKFVKEIYSSKGRALTWKLQKSKIRMIEQLRTNKLPDHPFSWAFYVVYGAQ